MKILVLIAIGFCLTGAPAFAADEPVDPREPEQIRLETEARAASNAYIAWMEARITALKAEVTALQEELEAAEEARAAAIQARNAAETEAQEIRSKILVLYESTQPPTP